ncbi:hypothetical protein [Mumia quercus]|uniref:hypothetical protein n=1 Tax=Mumia quercus TaxID=2976125 RepID=UPI0021CF080F|nr:hypothetical protein [Mumia quercus]
MHRHLLPRRAPGLVAAAALATTVVLTSPLPSWADDAAAYEATGKSVDGGASAGDATSLEAGDWKDTLGLTGTSDGQRWYTVKRTVDGSTVRLTAALPSGAPTARHSVTVEAFSGNSSCGKGDTSSAGGGHQPVVVASASAGGNGREECAEGDVTFSVTRETSDGTEEQQEEPLEIRVVEEAPAKDAEQLPTESADLPEEQPSLSDPDDLPGGGVSFDDAVALEPGAYRGSIAPGETRIYRVDLDWGQSLDAVAQFAPLTATQAEAFDNSDIRPSLVTYAPSRAVAADNTSNTYGRLNAYSSPELRATTPFVLYHARGAWSGASQAASTAGPYYVVLAAAPVEEGSGAAGAEVGVTLGVAVNGEVSGTPDFGDQQAVIGPDLDGGSSMGWLTWALVGLGTFLVVGGVTAVLIARRHAARARTQAPPYGGYVPPGQQAYPPYGGQQGPQRGSQHGPGDHPGGGW